jgi:hypothetical protein
LISIITEFLEKKSGEQGVKLERETAEQSQKQTAL